MLTFLSVNGLTVNFLEGGLEGKLEGRPNAVPLGPSRFWETGRG